MLSGLAALKQDRRRYDARASFTDPSLWSIAAYRLAQTITARMPRFLPALVVRQLVELIAYTISGNEIPHQAQIGPGLCIKHGKSVVLHTDVRIGRNCTLRQGVTIGSRVDGGPVPTLGDDVTLGAYAQVFGGITVGDGAKIGAMTVVLQDVPPGATAVGIPARIIPARPAARPD
jgi:serine O-acetyltransferase